MLEFSRPAGACNFYRPQTKFAKVMFSQVSVCPRGGGMHGGACVAWGACMAGCMCDGRACVMGEVCMAVGTCMVGACVAGEGHASLRGHVWQGACMAGGHVWLMGGMHGMPALPKIL